MIETGMFPNGIVNDDGLLCREYALAERTFRCSLELAHDQTIDKARLADPVYYDAAILSKRLTVPGFVRLTPEQVLNLEGDDADELARALMALDQRREEFRNQQQNPAQAPDSPPEAGGALG